jgi:hypothetical protein
MKAAAIIEMIVNTAKAPVGNRVPILIEGPPGIGKTETAKQAADILGGIVHNPNAEVTDPVDVGGFPRINGSDAMSYTRPWIMPPAAEDRPVILFVDEADKMLPSAQASWLSVFQNREVHGHKLGDNVTILAAANRTIDRTGGHNLIPALRSRVSAVTAEPDVNGWSQWAMGAGVPTVVVAFNRFRPELHFAFDPKQVGLPFPCPRSHVNVGKIVACGHSAEAEHALVNGTVGEGCGAEYIGFFRVFRSLPSIDGILLAPDSAVVPTDPATLYAVTTALAGRASQQNFGSIVRYGKRLPSEFSVFMVAGAVRREPAVQQTRAFIDWSSENAGVLI